MDAEVSDSAATMAGIAMLDDLNRDRGRGMRGQSRNLSGHQEAEAAMKFPTVLLAVALLAAPCAQADVRIGVRSVAAPAPERGTQLNVVLWYPAGPGGTPLLVGDNAVFEGVRAQLGAPVADGRFPVILLTHGGLRAAPGAGGWIAARLAAKGFVVAVPQRPDAGDQRAAQAVREIWLRPADLSATLTTLERDPALAGKIDVQRVGALGFLLGGSSALAVAGARRDAEAYARSCDQEGAGLDCRWFAKSGVDLHEVNAASLERSNLDPRIKAIVAVDPELTGTFTSASLSSITVPVHIINLGRPDSMLPDLNAGTLKQRIPLAQYDLVPGATHFDSFGVCKPDGPAILRDAGEDDSLCSDGLQPRTEIHRRLAAMIAGAFRRDL